jgi:hypothetical protein
LETSNKHH